MTMRSTTKTRLAAACSGLAVAAVAFSATAQEADEAAGTLQEVVVTARKRSESLQETPIAISAMSGEELTARGAGDISQLDRFTPNVTIEATAPISGSSNAAAIFIRGVGQSDFLISTDPGVGVYLDGVYIARATGGVLGLLDIEQVEVLRGPQGTLFGKNTIGGAINVTTKKPHETFEGEAEVLYGRFDRVEARGAVNVPLADGLGGRLSVGYKRSDGYGRRILTGESLGGENEFTARGALRWRPTDTFELNVAADYTTADEDSPVSTHLSGSEFNTIGAPGTLWGGLLYNNLIGAPGGIPGLVSLPALPATSVRYDERWVSDNLFESYGTGPTGSKFDVFGLSATAELKLGPMEVKSITAYRESDTRFGRDADGSPLTLVETTNIMATEQFSQELQFTGSAADRLKWLFGAYYLTESGTDRATVPFAQEAFDRLGQQGAFCTLFPGTRDIVLPCQFANPFRIDNVGDGVRMENESYALFGEATFEITERLSFTGGARWTRDEKMLDLSNQRAGGVPTIINNPVAKKTFSDTTYRAIVDYEASENALLYASYSEGFKSGGVNLRYGSPVASPTLYDPERVRAYEAGAKLEFLDRRARLNLAAFHSLYDDIQVVVFDNGIPRNINAAKGEISGFEAEATFAPSSEWLVQASYGYMDARYTKMDAAIIGSFGTPIQNPLLLSDRFVNTPEHSIALAVEHTRPLGGWGVLTVRVDGSYRSKWANDAVNTRPLLQDGVLLLNARAVIEPEHGRWSLAVFGRNLTDERYIVSGAGDERGLGAIEVNAAPPIEWGVSYNVRFGG